MFGFSTLAGAPFADTGEASSGILVELTGVSSGVLLGAVTLQTQNFVEVTGVNAVGVVGDETVLAGATVIPTGVASIVELGTAGLVINVEFSVTGVSARGVIGDVDAIGSVDVFATGFAIPTLLGNITLVTNNFIDVTGVTAIGVLGNTTETSGGAVIDLTGVYSVGRIGTVDVKADNIVGVTGVKTVVRLNKQNVWGLVNTAQTPNWTEVIAA